MIVSIEQAHDWLMSRTWLCMLITAMAHFTLAAAMPDNTIGAIIAQAMLDFWRGVSITIGIFHLSMVCLIYMVQRTREHGH